MVKKPYPSSADSAAQSSLTGLVRQFVGPDDSSPSSAFIDAPAPVDVELAMEDLVPDQNGEIVVFNDSGFRTLTILTEQPVVEEGLSPSHMTAGGEDVGGFRYVRFAGGTTIFFDRDLHLIVPQR